MMSIQICYGILVLDDIGMMMGDAGYGIVLSIFMALLIKATKPKGILISYIRCFTMEDMQQ